MLLKSFFSNFLTHVFHIVINRRKSIKEALTIHPGFLPEEVKTFE